MNLPEARCEISSPSLPAARVGGVRIWAFLWCWVCLVYVHQVRFDSPTPASRLDALHALVSQGRLAVDDFWTNTSDVAMIGGHYYSDKAPGTLALALPGFLLGAAGLKQAGVSLESRPGWLLSSWTACAGLALIVACGMVQLARLLAGLAGPAAGWLTAVALWFGAAPLPYATMLFSHAPVVACLAVGLWALSQARPEHMGLRPDATAARFPGRCLILTGFALGWALASEYSSGFVVLGLLVFVVGKR